MANTIAPAGASPVRSITGASWTGATNLYFIPQADGSQYQQGDFVGVAGGADANGVPAIAKASVAGNYRGILTGALLTYPGPSLAATALNYTTQIVPAVKAQGYYAMVMDDPNILCVLQDDGAVALTAAAIGMNASIVVANPTGLSQVSGTTLGTASVATTSTLTVKIMGLSPEPNNTIGKYANWLVKINTHDLVGATTGI